MSPNGIKPELVPIGGVKPKPLPLSGVPPAERFKEFRPIPKPPVLPESQQKAESWYARADEYRDKAGESEKHVEELAGRIQRITAIKPSPLAPGLGVIGTLMQLPSIARSIGTIREFGFSEYFKLMGEDRKQLRAEIDATSDTITRDLYFAKVYQEVPLFISVAKSAGEVPSPSEILSQVGAVPVGLAKEEYDQLLADVEEMVEAVLPAHETPRVLPEMALEAEEPELPELEIPEPVSGVPVNINQLTIEEIMKALTVPMAPPTTLTPEEWANWKVESGQISDEADLERVEYYKDLSKAITDSWKEHDNMLQAYRDGMAKMPEFEVVDLLKELVVMPGMGLLDVAKFYFEHVSMPLAGKVYKSFIPDIEAAYQRYKKEESEWKALQLAWEEWDSPGDGAASWMLKYLLMEGLVDPLTYVGWGLGAKLVRPIPFIGKRLSSVVGGIEGGFAGAFELPFDMLKFPLRSRWAPELVKKLHLPERYAGQYVIPRTLGQRATIAMHEAGQYVEVALTKRFGKALWQMSSEELRKGITDVVSYTLKSGHQVDNEVTRAGRELLKHVPFTEKDVWAVAQRLNTTLSREHVTKHTVETVDRIFEDFFVTIRNKRKLASAKESGARLIYELSGENTEDMLVVASKMFQERASQIISSAMSYAGEKNVLKAMRDLMRRNYGIWIKSEESTMALARREMGSITGAVKDVELLVQKTWAAWIDKWVVRTFAESYLTFALYGPMNVIEDVIRHGLGGAFPGTKTYKALTRKWAGVSMDQTLATADRGISEIWGVFRARPKGEINNWILQLGGLARGFGDKLYGALVEAPGRVGMGIRIHYIDSMATKILKEIGGEQFEKLAKVATRFSGTGNAKINRQVNQAATELAAVGSIRESFDALKMEFTRAAVLRREMDNILMQHPGLARSVRDYAMKQFDDDLLFSSVVTPVKTISHEIPDAAKYKVGECFRNSWKWTIDNRAGYTIHGKVYSIQSGKMIDHAWVEVGNDVIDPTAGIRMDRSEWYKLSKAKPEAAYTSEQYSINMMAVGKHGPWTVEEVAGNITQLSDVSRAGIVPPQPTIGDSIDGMARDADTMIVDDFLRSAEHAHEGYEALAQELIALEVRNPEEMAQLMRSLNIMSNMSGATPKQIMGRAVERSRGLPLAERRLTMDKAMDSITIFRERANASMDKVTERIKATLPNVQEPRYVTEAERLFDLQTAKRLRASELGEQVNAYRHNLFAEADPTDLKSPEFWDDYGREVSSRWDNFDVEMAEMDAMIDNAIESLNRTGGVTMPTRAPLKVVDRPLSTNDVAMLVGARGDDISRAILDVMVPQNSRNHFVAYVMGKVKPGDEGFTREAVGEVYDRLMNELVGGAQNASWVSGQRLELEAVRRDLHGLYNSKMLPDEEVANISKYLDGTANAVEDIMNIRVPARGKQPARLEPRPEYANYSSLKQQAMDEAHKWYYKEFTDYTNANVFDAIMKFVYPFWTYETQRWFWLPRSFIRHPGTFTFWGRWQDNTDRGYIHIPGTSIDFNPFRGTVYGTLTTRLSRRDFPEYYDSLNAASNALEFNDFLSRYGFYPGAHIGIPITMFGGVEMQFGEAMPAIIKTPLDFLIATFPDNESVRWISDRVFGDRFRNYMTMITVNRMGGKGTLIFAKMQEGKALTPEEEQVWADARREVGWYSAAFEQFSLFRLRTDEQYKMYEEAAKVIEEMTGFTPEQQDWLREHGYRLWDMVGGMSPSQQAALQELGYYKWVGQVRPLLPGKQQAILNEIELAWNEVEIYTEGVLQRKLELQRDLLSGARGARDYNEELLGTFDDQRKYIETKTDEHPLMQLENRKDYYKEYKIPQPVLHPMRELMNLFFSIELEETTDPETGEKMMDWDNFWAQRMAIEQSIPDDYKQEWEDFLAKNSTRVEEVRREVYSQYFRPYNQLWDTVLKTYPDNEQEMIEEFLHLERTNQNLDRQKQIKEAISEKTGNQLISSFRSELSDAKRALRYKNPHLDAWLYFWDRTQAFTAPGAEEIYYQIAKEVGRKL